MALSSLSILVTSAAIPAYAQAIPPGDKLITPYNSYVQIVFAGASCESNNHFGYVNYPANDPEYRTQIGTTEVTPVGTTVGLGDFAAGQELILYIENSIGLLWLTGPADRCCFDTDFPHAKIVQINESVYRVSFEDTSEIFSDKDYDDVIMDVYFIKPTASVSVATGAGGLVNEPSTSTGTVTLSRAFSWPVTVTVAADGGTATYGTDYAIGLSGAADSSSLAFDFAPGETSRTFEVRVKDDHTYSNPYEYFNVHVASTSDNAIANTTLVPVTISEETIVPTVRLNQASYTVDEPAAGIAVSVPFTVTLSEPCSFDTTVNIGTVAGSASAVTDFSLTAGSIIIPAGQTTGTGSVTVLGDGLFSSPNKTFSIVITGVDHSIGIGTPGQATVTINEYSSSSLPIPPTVQLNSDTYTAIEPASGTVAVPFTVSISEPCDFDVIVNMETIAGTAIAGEDYDLAAASVTIPARATSADGSLLIKNDGLFSLSDQQFTLRIAGATSPVGIGVQSQATVTIKEYLTSAGLAPTVQFNATDYYVKEPAGYLSTAMPFNVTLSEPCDFPVTVYVGTIMGTALPVDDYTTLIEPIVFNPGETSATGYVTVKGDGRYSAEDQKFKIHVFSITDPLSVGNPGVANVTIGEYLPPVDPVIPTVQLNSTAYSVDEPAGYVATTKVPFNVTLSRPCDFQVMVTVVTEPGTALPVDDYTTLIDPVILNPGETEGTGYVTVKGDGKYSAEDQQFKLRLIGVSIPLTIGSPGEATVTIREYSSPVDPTPPTVQFNSTSYTVDEPAGYGTIDVPFNVTISEPCDFPVTVTVGTTMGTAVPVDDYTTLIASPVTINPGETSATGYVTVKGDGLYSAEGQQFTLDLISVTSPLSIGTPATATVTIKEYPYTPGPFPPRVQFDASSYPATEPGAGLTGSVPFTITISEPCDFDTTVQLRTVAGTAVAGTNYDATVADVLIPAGASSAVGSVTILNDYTYSPSDEAFTLEIAGNNRLLGTGTPAQATVTITNCDPRPVVQLNASAYDAPEDGTGYVNVTLTGNSSTPVIVQYTIDGVPGTYTFDPATRGFALIPVPVSNEPGIQTGRTLSFVITGVSDNAQPGMPTSAIITVLEKEQTYTIHLKKGWNMISSPLVIEPFMASEITQYCPAISQVMQYDTTRQSFSAYLIGISPDGYDFQVQTDVGYLVYADTDADITFTGSAPDGRSIGIGSGWSMIGWSTYSSSDAVEISGMLVPGEQQIMMYDNPASTFTAYLEGISPADYNFNMAPGNGYLIYTATPTTLNFREIENNV